MAFNREGLKFRELEPSDLEILRLQRNNSWQGYRNPYPVMTLSNQQDWYETLGPGNWAFMVLDSDIPVGLLRISQFDRENRSAGITGVDVFPGSEGRGIATRIMRAAAQYLLHDLGFHRCWGQCMDNNPGMRKAMEKAGYKLEATFRQAIWRNGVWHDFLQFSILDIELWNETKVLEGL